MNRKRINYPDKPPKRMIPSTSPGFFYAVEDLCRRMRVEERRQHMLVMGGNPDEEDYNPMIAARGMLQLGGVAFWYVNDEKRPVAAGGYVDDPTMPGVWQSWMVGTEEGWGKYWQDLTKGSRWLISQLLTGGARRLETTVLAGRDEAMKWHTDFLGMRVEGTRRRYFPDGSDMILCSITDRDWLEINGIEEAADGRQ